MKLLFVVGLLWAVIASTAADCNCPQLDIVFAIDRFHFTRQRYESIAKPIFEDVSRHIHGCSDLHISFLEYASTHRITASLNEYANTAQALNALATYAVGDNIGTFALMGDALEAIRLQVLNPDRGHRQTAKTFVVVFTGSSLIDADLAMSEADALKQLDATDAGNLTMVVVRSGETDDQLKDQLQAIATDAATDYLTTDWFGNQRREIAANLIDRFITAECNDTQEPVTIRPYDCAAPDVVFLVDRTYFDQAKWQTIARPIFQLLATRLAVDPLECVRIQTAYVEYGDDDMTVHPFNDFRSVDEVRAFMGRYAPPTGTHTNSNAGGGYSIARTEALTTRFGQRLSSPSHVVTLLGSNPRDQAVAVMEADRLKLDKDAIVSVLGFENGYDPATVRVLASSPSAYHQVNAATATEFSDAVDWLLETLMITTAPTTVVPPTPAPGPQCAAPDVIFAIQQSCGNQADFDYYMQPILTRFEHDLPACVNISTAYVEYGDRSAIRHRFDYFNSSSSARHFMSSARYRMGDELGDGARLDCAYSDIRYHVQRKSLEHPTYVFTLLCQNPTDQMKAIEEAEYMKMNGAVSSVLAFGDRFARNNVRILASRSDLFWTIDMPPLEGEGRARPAVNPTDYKEITDWMIRTILPPALDVNATIPETSTAATTEAPTNETTTVFTWCRYRDFALSFEHQCFKDNFEEVVKPILQAFLDETAACVRLSPAIIEYGEHSNLRYNYYSFGYDDGRLDPRDFLNNTYTISPWEYGTENNVHDAFRQFNDQVMRKQDAVERALDNPTPLFTFICHDPTHQLKAVDELAALQLNGGVSAVIAFDDGYENNAVRVLANSPADEFYRVANSSDFSSADQQALGRWMAGIVDPAPLFIPTLPPSNTTNQTSTAAPDEWCAHRDVVFIFDRRYFNESTFEDEAKPILQNYVRTLDACVALSVATIEFGSRAELVNDYSAHEAIEGRRLLDNYQLSTSDFGEDSNFHEAIQLANNNVLRARALTNPTAVFSLLGTNPTDQFEAIKQVERMKMNGGESNIIAFGDEYAENWLRPLSDDPATKYSNPATPPQSINDKMIEATYPARSGPLPTIPTPPAVNSTLPPLTTLIPPPAVNGSTPDANFTTPVNSTTPVTSTTTPVPVCRYSDVVFVFERACFTDTFDTMVQPILSDFADRLDACVHLSTSYVEYGSWAGIAYGWEDHETDSEARQFMKAYPLGEDRGDQSNAHEAFRTVNYNVLREAQTRSITNPTSVFTFLCNTPTKRVEAVWESESMKLNGAQSTVIAFGDEPKVEEPSVRVLASSPNTYHNVPTATPANLPSAAWFEPIVDAMLRQVNPPSFILPNTTTTMAPNTTESSNTTCALLDFVFVFDRSYFSKWRFNQTVAPLFQEIAEKLPECIDMRTAVVEYGTNARPVYYLNTYTAGEEARRGLASFEPGSYMGSGQNLHEGLKIADEQVLQEERGKRRIASRVVVFTGNNPSDSGLAGNYADRLKQLPSLVTVIAYGTNYDEDKLKPLASTGDQFFPVSDQQVIEDYVFYSIVGVEKMIAEDEPTPIPLNMSSLPILPDPIPPSAPGVVQPCCQSDVVMVVDRSYFTTAAQWQAEGRPVIQDFFIRQMPACAQVRLGIVEYGTFVYFSRDLDSSELRTTMAARQLVNNWEPTTNVGTGANLAKAFKAIRSQVIISEHRRKNVPLTVMLMGGSNPAELAETMYEADALKMNEATVFVYGFGSNYEGDLYKLIASDATFSLAVDDGTAAAASWVEFICPNTGATTPGATSSIATGSTDHTTGGITAAETSTGTTVSATTDSTTSTR